MRLVKANHNIINILFSSQTLIMGGSVPARVPWAIFQWQADALPWKRSFFPRRGAESRGVWFILRPARPRAHRGPLARVELVRPASAQFTWRVTAMRAWASTCATCVSRRREASYSNDNWFFDSWTWKLRRP